MFCADDANIKVITLPCCKKKFLNMYDKMV